MGVFVRSTAGSVDLEGEHFWGWAYIDECDFTGIREWDEFRDWWGIGWGCGDSGGWDDGSWYDGGWYDGGWKYPWFGEFSGVGYYASVG